MGHQPAEEFPVMKAPVGYQWPPPQQTLQLIQQALDFQVLGCGLVVNRLWKSKSDTHRVETAPGRATPTPTTSSPAPLGVVAPHRLSSWQGAHFSQCTSSGIATQPARHGCRVVRLRHRSPGNNRRTDITVPRSGYSAIHLAFRYVSPYHPKPNQIKRKRSSEVTMHDYWGQSTEKPPHVVYATKATPVIVG